MIINDVQEGGDDVYVLGLRESTSEESSSILIFETSHDIDDEEVDLGMDTYCLVVEPSHATHYGGVTHCEIQDVAESGGVPRLILQLEDNACETLGLPPQITFELAVNANQIELIRSGLRRVLTSGRPGAVPIFANV